MASFDVFNGDADGICALIQLRNAEARESTLVTGVKRDINLLRQVAASEGDKVTALDISMDKNREDLLRILEAGADVMYCDHHFPGDIPESSRLHTIINEAPDVCTSLLINSHLKGQFLEWGIVGTFGDNLKKSAQGMAKNLTITADQLNLLEALGIYINYNGYGSELDDLHFRPDELYQLAVQYSSPFDFIRDGKQHFEKLETGYHEDMRAAKETKPLRASQAAAIFVLPDAPWARRVSGVYSNDLTNAHPDRAHAVLTEKANGNYLVSVRAPLSNKTGAVDLCKAFPTGGGRAAAAGINDLPSTSLEDFIAALEQQYTLTN